MRGKQHLRGQRRDPRRFAVACVAVAVVLSLAGLFISRAVRIANLRNEIATLTVAQQQAKIDREALREKLLTVNDREVIETAARSLLGLVYPGEEKVIFVDEE